MRIFLQCVAEALVEQGVRRVMQAIPGGEWAFDLAQRVFEKYREYRQDAQLVRQEIQQISQSSAEAIATLAQEIGHALTASPREQTALALYLAQIPTAIRHSQQRSQDPSGCTMAYDFVLRQPTDVLALLPTAIPQFCPGDELPGLPGWQLQRLLGMGGFGEVWLAGKQGFGSLLGAVKFCRSDHLWHEAKLIDRLLRCGHHPNIVRLLNVHLEGATPWLMYQYIEGGDLRQQMAQWARLPPHERQAVVRVALKTLATAMGYFHRLEPPIVHRDLKPANILYDPQGQLYITDFGIGGLAVPVIPGAMTQSGHLRPSLYGSHTPGYASPQQGSGSAPNPQDDVYALGVLGYQMLMGQGTPGVGVDWADDLADMGIDPQLIAVLKKCVAHSPTRRWHDANAVAAALAEVSIATAAPIARKPAGAMPVTAQATARQINRSGFAFETVAVNRQGQPIKSHTGQAQQAVETLPGGMLIEMVWVAGGSFEMGSHDPGSEANERPVHRVMVSSFYLGKYPVTQAQWQAVMGAHNPSAFQGAQLPVDNLSWDDAQAFIQRFNQQTWRRYSLPSEAELEYACRAGTTTPFAYGETISAHLANYDGNNTYADEPRSQSWQQTTLVGRFPANALGLYDLHGNVWEWCADGWHPDYHGAPTDGSAWITGGNSALRVLRGGSWRSLPGLLRSARRSALAPNARFYNGGFRLRLADK